LFIDDLKQRRGTTIEEEEEEEEEEAKSSMNRHLEAIGEREIEKHYKSLNESFLSVCLDVDDR
jgi:hypothetical protein